jgi:hypothetical protein
MPLFSKVFRCSRSVAFFLDSLPGKRLITKFNYRGSQAWIRSFHPVCWHAWRAGHRSFMATKTSKKIGSKDISNAASSKFERCQKPLIHQSLRFSDSPGSIPITTWLNGWTHISWINSPRLVG